MSDHIHCNACGSEFRIARRPSGEQTLRVACPGCGMGLTIEPKRRPASSPSPELDAPQGTPTPPPPEATARRPGWRSLDHSALFGRPSPPPPEIEALPGDDDTTDGDSLSLDEAFDDGDWIDAAIDDAADEIFWVDDTPTEMDRLPGAYPPDIPPSRSDEPTAPPPTQIPEDEASPPSPDEEHRDEGRRDTEVGDDPPKAVESDDPVEATAPETPPFETGGETSLASALDATSYRLRIGDEVYADITPDDLVTLLRRGVWLVADDIAEGDGDFRPIEDHPIFERVQNVVAQSVTTFLAARARLVTSESADDAPLITDAALEAPGAPVASRSVLHPASHLIPWSIALITTGVASAAVTYALLSDPEPAPLEADAAVVEPTATAHGANAPSTAPGALNDATQQASSLVAASSAPSPLDLVEQALDDGDVQMAQQLAAHHFQDIDDLTALQDAFDRAIDADTTYDRHLRTMKPDQGVDALRALGGGRSVTLRFTNDGQSQYAYKVARDDWEYGWRAEIAAFKLGELIGVDVPINEPARISRNDFDELYGRVDTPRQQNYADDRFQELHWNTEAGPDGLQRDYLYGTLKEWIPHYEEFPLEYVDAWRDLLRADSDPDLLAQPAHQLVDRFDEHSQQSHQALAGELRGHTKEDIARQISTLHVFDFLMNNFDRYSGVPEFYGVNSHFRDGRFIAIDNSSGFQFRDRPELALLDRRLQPIQRFERSTINTLRLLHPDLVDPILFPNPDSDEEQRLDFFWEQRQALLDHVDALIDEHGEEAIYF